MKQGTIAKNNLAALVAAVTKDGRFYGPVMSKEGARLVEIGPDSAPTTSYSNVLFPVKRLFLPQCETLGACEGGAIVDRLPADEKIAVFGVRPCDASSLLLLDAIFLDETFADPYYRKRRDNAVIIALACTAPLETCFCTSVGGSPADGKGADIRAGESGEELVFEAVTKKGEAFLAEHSDLFEETEGGGSAGADVAGKMSEVNVSGIDAKLQEKFESDIWHRMAERCLSCGVCTNVCPTCHCFGIYDETAPGGRRIRAQDACMFPSFTLEASGHNPRPAKGDRLRQRIMHKFLYTVKNVGDMFCVGCGRCITACPVNMDVRETIDEVLK